MRYLQWAKQHGHARYSLVSSGVPPVQPAELGFPSTGVALTVNGAYGDPALIDTVAALYAMDPRGIVPVPGTSSANFIAVASVTSAGSCILMEHPTYEPLRRVADFLRLKVCPLRRNSRDGFGLDIGELEAGLRAGAKALILTNLHNPSGSYTPEGRISEISQVCENAGAKVIIDEVYLDANALTGSTRRWSAATLGSNVITTSSLTKVYGLGGLRAGWLAASPPVAERAREIMDLLSVENAAPAVSLTLQAFAKLRWLEARYCRFHREGQAVFRSWLASEPRVQGYENHGALFEWVRLPEDVSGAKLAVLLAEEYETQIVPGSFFGRDDHIRLSTALMSTDLREALSRISTAIRVCKDAAK